MKFFNTNSKEETIELGSKIGSIFKLDNPVILLKGDLATGKTTLTKGIGKGLNIDRKINSPTFTILKRYQGDVLLYHFDFYRLEGNFFDYDFYDYIDGDGFKVVEWPDQAKDLLPSNYLLVEIKYIKDNERQFMITYQGEKYKRGFNLL